MNPSATTTTTVPALRISQLDHQRLRLLVEGALAAQPRDRESLLALRGELERAEVLPPEVMPRDVVVMGSRVEIADLGSGEVDTYTLVFPEFADAEKGHLSILAPIGTAIIGFKAGDTFSWPTPGGVRRLKLRSVRPPSAD